MRKSTSAKRNAATTAKPEQKPLLDKINASFRPDGGAVFFRSIDRHTWSRVVPPDGRVTATETAALLGVQAMSVYRWIEAGELTADEKRPVTITLASVRRLARHRGEQ